VPTVSSGSHLSPPYLFLQFNHALEQSQTLANSESIDLGYAFSCPLHVCTVCLSAAYSTHHQCCFVRLPYPCSGLSIIFILSRLRCCSLLLLLPLPVQDHWLLANSIRIPALGQALSYPLHVCIVCLSAAYSAHHQCWFVRLPYGLSPLLTLFFSASATVLLASYSPARLSRPNPWSSFALAFESTSRPKSNSRSRSKSPRLLWGSWHSVLAPPLFPHAPQFTPFSGLSPVPTCWGLLRVSVLSLCKLHSLHSPPRANPKHPYDREFRFANIHSRRVLHEAWKWQQVPHSGLH
jgi:hypothetical protein